MLLSMGNTSIIIMLFFLLICALFVLWYVFFKKSESQSAIDTPQTANHSLTDSSTDVADDINQSSKNTEDVAHVTYEMIEMNPIITSLKKIKDLSELYAFINTLQEKDSKYGSDINDIFTEKLKPFQDHIDGYLNSRSSTFSAESSQEKMHEALKLYEVKESIEKTSLEMKALISPYLSYSDKTSQLRADLEKFARVAEQELLDELLDQIGKTIEIKQNLLLNRIDKELNTKERLKDILPFGKSFLEKIINEEMGEQNIRSSLECIGKDIQENFEQKWKKKVEQNAPDLKMMKTLAVSASKNQTPAIGINTEIASQVLTGGMGATIAATFGLAAGWHTLNYALIYVFPPAVIIALLLTAITFKFTGKQACESRKQCLEKIIQQYYSQIIISIFKKKFTEFRGNSLPVHLHYISDQCVGAVMTQWEKQYTGNLSIDDYRNLSIKVSQQLEMLNNVLNSIQGMIDRLKK